MTSDEAERAADALRAIPADCPRDVWLKAMMGAHAGDVPMETVQAWSAQSEKYDPRAFSMAWRSIKPNGGVTVATLYAVAREYGWRDPRVTSVAHNGHAAARLANGAASTQVANGQAAAKPPARAINGAAHGESTERAASPLDATRVWEACTPAPASHGYIRAKGGVAEGLRVVPADAPLTASMRVAGWLALPFHSIADGRLCTLQFVPPPEAKTHKLNLREGKFDDSAFITGNVVPDGRLYVCEGIGQAWACVRADPSAAAAVTAGVGRFATVARALSTRYPNAHIVLMPDRGKEADAERVAQEVRGAWAGMPADKPSNYDSGDFAAEFGDEALAGLLTKPRRPEIPFELMPGATMLDLPPQNWLVHDVIPHDGFVALYGAPGSGKSFLALDMAAAIAEGREWFGHRTRAAPVTYCALEGRAGLSQRVRAWHARTGRAVPARLWFMVQELNLRSDVPELTKSIAYTGNTHGLIVVDTLARSMTAFDENSSEGMGALVAACGELQRLTCCAVLLVHHSGKDTAKGERGHSSLRAALDASIEVVHEGGLRHWRVSKAKDGEDAEQTSFDLRVVPVGMDEFGGERTSCVVVPAQASAPPPPGLHAPTRARQQVVYETVGILLKASRDFGKGGAPVTRPCVRHEDAVEAIAPKLAQYAPNKQRWAAKQAIFSMQGQWYDTDGEWLWHR